MAASMPVATMRALRLEQRHRLALHVRTHQGAVGIVVFQERDERGRDGDELLGRDVHVVDHLAGQLGDLRLSAAGDALVDERAVLVERLVRLRDDVLVLLVRGEIVDLVGDADDGGMAVFVLTLL